LHDVAAEAEVSIATVSRALNGLLVSRDSEARVRRAVAKLGYVANQTARALRNERSLALGLIFFELSTARGLGLLDALSSVLETAGYSLLIATARGDEQTYARLLRRFVERRVDGLFCVSPVGTAESAAFCANAGIPILALRTRSDAFRGIPLVEPIFAAAGERCTAELHALGHRRLAFIDDETQLSTVGMVGASWRDPRIEVERVTLDEIGGIDEWIHQMRGRKNRPTVIAASERQAEAALAVCRASAIAVPGEMSILAVSTAGDEARAQRLNLSSVLLDSRRLGQAAGKAMLAWLEGTRPKGKLSVEVGTWVPRGTTGRAK
jgi:LacI family transcriptional regulator